MSYPFPSLSRLSQCGEPAGCRQRQAASAPNAYTPIVVPSNRFVVTPEDYFLIPEDYKRLFFSEG